MFLNSQIKSNLQCKPKIKLTAKLQSKLLVVLAIQLGLFSHAVAEMSAGCEIQIVRADVERLQYVPTVSQNPSVLLNKQTSRIQTGQQTYEVVADRPGAKTYKVSLNMKVEANRSPWKSSNARLTVMTKLLSEQGQVLAISESHSDQLYTPKMLEWINEGQKPMLISKLFNPEVLNLLLGSGDEQLMALAETNLDQAVQMGLAQKIILPDMAYIVDTVCRIQ